MDKNQANNHQDGAGGTDQAPEELRIPRATVARIMRHGSPPNSKITGDAKEAVDNCLVEFCAVFIAAAVEECRRDKRTTVTGDDLIFAMRNLGFDDYVRPLALYLRRYREIEGNRPRARHSSMAALDPTAPAVGAEVQQQQPPPGLNLQLGPPPVRDVTELGPHADVYAVWRAAAAAAAGTSQAPGGADDEDEE
ncbi:nuclear transcription factor Y subunit B-4-like [Panicum hallii]|nr:nuclear transcription factor Y subunit B-4-like [Panicum hallii]